MRSLLKPIGCAAACMLAAAGALAGDDDEAGTHALRGDYGFTLTQACVRTPFQRPPAAGFDSATHQLLVNAEAISAIGAGIMRFAKDGGVTVEDAAVSEVQLNQIAAGQVPVAPKTEFDCTGSYVLQPQNKIAVTLSCNAHVSQPGVTVTVAPFEFVGFLNHRGRVTSLSSVEGNLQTVTVAAGGQPVQQRQRICAQSLVLDKL